MRGEEPRDADKGQIRPGCVGLGEGLGVHSKCNEKLLESFQQGSGIACSHFQKVILADL